MKKLQSDDYTVGTFVTVFNNPYSAYSDSIPSASTDMHGRVFKIIAFDPPGIILLPLDGRGALPTLQQCGPAIVMVSPTDCSVTVRDTRELELWLVNDEYAAAYAQYCKVADCVAHGTELSLKNVIRRAQ